MVNLCTIERSEELPLVSICMIAYNKEEYIKDSIEGVLDQEYDFSCELVIGEDFSEDGTRKICMDYSKKYPFIRVIINDRNLGLAANYNRTLKHCRGKYIAICDADDQWITSDKLSKQVDFLERNIDHGVVYTDVKIKFEGHSDQNLWIKPVFHSGLVFFRLLKENFVMNSSVLFRSSLLQGVNLEDDRDYFSYDYLMYLHFATKCKFGYLPEQTTLYRRHQTNISSKHHSNKRRYQRQIANIVLLFEKNYVWPLSPEEKMKVFRTILGILIRGHTTFFKKVKILPLGVKYFPGIYQMTQKLFSGL